MPVDKCGAARIGGVAWRRGPVAQSMAAAPVELPMPKFAAVGVWYRLRVSPPPPHTCCDSCSVGAPCCVMHSSGTVSLHEVALHCAVVVVHSCARRPVVSGVRRAPQMGAFVLRKCELLRFHHLGTPARAAVAWRGVRARRAAELARACVIAAISA